MSETRKRKCVGYGEFEGKCENDAGTPWTPYWCERCDTLRKAAISAQLEHLVRYYEEEVRKGDA